MAATLAGALPAAAALAGALSPATALGAEAAAAGPARSDSPSIGTARLQGQFLMRGRITVAVDVRGEHVGQKVTRRWTFTPLCATGQCARVQLVRQRSAGSDRLTMRRLRAGYYTGSGSFYAGLRCGRRTVRKGELVPFTITVQITAATVSVAGVLATQITATYTNRKRINLTPCVTPLIHDAARYTGQRLST